MFSSFKKKIGNSLVVQWLGFSALNAVAWRSVPGLKTKVLKLHGAGQKKKIIRGLPSGPGVKTVSANARGAGLIPGHVAKIPHASRPKHETEAIL